MSFDDGPSERPAPIVELTPQPRDVRSKIAIGLALLALGLAAAIAIGFEAHAIVRDEAQLWQIASSTHGTREDWQRYVDFAEGAESGWRGWLTIQLTAVSVRAPLAAENVIVASAERAGAEGNDELLCTLRDAHRDTRGGALASSLLREHRETRLAAFARSADAHGAPPGARDTLILAARADDPCRPLGMVAFTRTTDPDLDRTLPFGEATLRDHVDVRDRSVIEARWTGQLSDELGSALGVPLTGDDEGGPLVIEVVTSIHTQGEFAARRGAMAPGLALEASLRIHARTMPPGPIGEPAYTLAFHVDPSTSPALAIASASSQDELDAIYGRMLAELDTALLARVRLELGLGATSIGASAGDCDDFDPLPLVGVVHGDTREGRDAWVGSCSSEQADFEAREDCDECWEEQQRPSAEITYRMVLAERTRVAIQAEPSDGRPMVVYVQDGCGPSAGELGCQELSLTETLDPGVYAVVVDETESGSGSFDVVARSRSAPLAAAACRAATPLTSGVTVHGDTSHATDSFESACGGVGSREQVYAVDVIEASRLRCSVSAEFAVSIDEREDAASEARACALANETLSVELAPGRHYVVVDGATHDQQGTFVLTCEIASAAGVDEAARPLTSPLVVDTMRARSDSRGSCGSTDGPDLAYRVEVEQTSHLHFASAGPATTLYLRDATRELGCHEGTLDLDVTPGTYTLVVDSGSGSFGARTITFASTDLHALCSSSPPLPLGPSSGTVRGGTTSFAGTCVGDGAETLQRLVLGARSHVVIRGHLSFSGGLYVRRACDDWHTELTCVRTAGRDAIVDLALDAGTYELIVDSATSYGVGAYTLDVAVDAI